MTFHAKENLGRRPSAGRAHCPFARVAIAGMDWPRSRMCLVATATVLGIPRIGSAQAPMSCLCTGHDGSGPVALPVRRRVWAPASMTERHPGLTKGRQARLSIRATLKRRGR
jgi:hypothetical protein